MRKIALFLTAAFIAGSMTFAAAPAGHATGYIPALANIRVTAPNANTTIVITGNNVLASQHLTVSWDGQYLSPSCSGPTMTGYGELWSCSTVTDWYVTLGNATNNIDARQAGALVHVMGNRGHDTVNVKNGHGYDTVDCGQSDGVKDWVYKGSADTVSHCSSGGDYVGS
jgi:hypothetical protein